MHQRFVEISVKGEVDPTSVVDFEHVTVTIERGVTRLGMAVRDDSALYGLLAQLESSGFEVLAVYPHPESPPGAG